MRLLSVTMVLLLFVSTVNAQATSGKELFEPTTGAALNIPDNWVFRADKNHLLAVSDDQKAMVILMKTDANFGDEISKLETSLAERVFENVDLDEAVILVGAERGGFEAAVALKGSAIHKKDGQPVTFSAMLVKTGDRGSLVLGAWKNPTHAEMIQEILDTFHIRRPGTGGLELTHLESGATVKLPKGWQVMSYRKGLIGFAPDRGAMILIVKSDDQFADTVKRARAILTTRIFKNVKIEEFKAVVAVDRHGFREMVTASGSAQDQVDDKNVEFHVIAAEQPGDDEGILIVGAWKDKAHMEMVRKTLESLHIKN